MAPREASLTVEIEVARGALLEPQSVVVGRVLEKVRRLFEHVLAFPRLLDRFLVEPMLGGDLFELRTGPGRQLAGRPGRRRGRSGQVGHEARRLAGDLAARMRFPLLSDLVMPGPRPLVELRLALVLAVRFRLLGGICPPGEILVGRIASLRGLLIKRVGSGWGCLLGAYQVRWLLRRPANRTQCLALEAVDLGRVGATAALEVKMLANRVVE